MERRKEVLRSVKGMEPFVILAEEGRGEEISEFLLSTCPFTGKRLPPYCFEIGAEEYYFGWNGTYYVAGFSEEFLHLPKYQFDDFKYLFQLERVLE